MIFKFLKFLKNLIWFCLFVLSIFLFFIPFVYTEINRKPIKSQSDFIKAMDDYHSFWGTRIPFWFHAQLFLGGNRYLGELAQKKLEPNVAIALYEKQKLMKLKSKKFGSNSSKKVLL